jgi:zinc transporter
MKFAWLSQDDRQHINEAANKFARMAEELEAVRERAALLHEQISDLRAEQLDARGLQLSVVAFIFLPLTFLTGLLGMNVAGIPYAEEPWAFGAVVGACLAIAFVISAYFIWRHRVHEQR